MHHSASQCITASITAQSYAQSQKICLQMFWIKFPQRCRCSRYSLRQVSVVWCFAWRPDRDGDVWPLTTRSFFVFDTQLNGSWGGDVVSFCPTKNIKKCCHPGATAAISSSLVNSPQRRCTSCASASRNLGREHVEHVSHKAGGATQICYWQIGEKLLPGRTFDTILGHFNPLTTFDSFIFLMLFGSVLHIVFHSFTYQFSIQSARSDLCGYASLDESCSDHSNRLEFEGTNNLLLLNTSNLHIAAIYRPTNFIFLKHPLLHLFRCMLP